MLVNIQMLIDDAKCHEVVRQFDDLTETIFEGHHQPLRVWVLCLYFMGLNLSNDQIAAELDLDADTVQVMAAQLRAGVVVKKARLLEWRN